MSVPDAAHLDHDENAARTVPVRQRVVEVIADTGEDSSPRWRYGSGFVVNGRVVLTAAHVLVGAVAVAIRGPDKVLLNGVIDPALVGDPELLDVALFEVPGMKRSLPAVLVAAIDRDISIGDYVEQCWAVGYPRFTETSRGPDGRVVRETAQVSGRIPLLTGLAEGLLALEVVSAPRELPASPITESPWSGMSGAAVFAADALIGVVTDTDPRRGPSMLTVTPLSFLRDTYRAPKNADRWWATLGVAEPSALRSLPVGTQHLRSPAEDAASRAETGTVALNEESVVASDSVEWVPDAPAKLDLLNRKPVADMLARRLRRLSEDTDPDGVREPASFLIHLDGRWGSGKSSILNFLKAELEGGDRPWLVVEFNAWQQAQVGPAWWALLTALRQRMLQDLGPVRRWRLRFADSWHRGRATGAPYALAIVLVVAIAAAVLFAVGPAKLGAAKPADAAKTITAVVGAIGAIWAGALLVGRFVLWDSPTGARLFEQSNRNPMTYLRDHFGWTIDQVGRPVVFFIDDLDRCEQASVVGLLDGIQTLVRDAGRRESSPGPFFVVAADGGWIRGSYDEQYRSLAGTIAEPGQDLGWLFLDKLFQLTVRVPDLSRERQSSYMSRLLDTQRATEQDAGQREAILTAIERSRTQAEVHEAWGSASPAMRESVAAEAVARLTDEDVEARTEHHLQKFAPLLDRNPRRMKRFLNIYTAEVVTSGLEQRFPSADELALWTILRIQWPVLARALSARPDLVECIRGTQEAPAGLTDDVVQALTVKELRLLVDFEHGGPLTPARIERLIGRADVDETANTRRVAGEADGSGVPTGPVGGSRYR